MLKINKALRRASLVTRKIHTYQNQIMYMKREG